MHDDNIPAPAPASTVGNIVTTDDGFPAIVVSEYKTEDGRTFRDLHVFTANQFGQLSDDPNAETEKSDTADSQADPANV